jgi:hypothetical protein
MKVSYLTATLACVTALAAASAQASFSSIMLAQEITKTARCVDAMTPTHCQVDRHFSLTHGITTFAECSSGVRVFTRRGEWRIFPLSSIGTSKREAVADMNETKSLLSLIPRCR